MRITDRRRRVGGVAAVVAAFWLGFVCGGGESLPGAAAIREPSGPRQQEPAPAAQPPEEPAPAAQPPEEPAPAAQPPEEPDAAPQPPEGPDVVPEESTEADAVPEESTEADPEADAPGAEPPLVQDRPRVFTSNTGILLNFLQPGSESAFEETLTRVAEALAGSDSEERRRQAEGWSTYRAEEPLADGVLLYVSWLDPAVPGADYWIPGILNEAYPTEAQALYETYAGAFADGQILLNLSPVAGP